MPFNPVWGIEPDAILMSDIRYQIDGPRPLILYGVEDWQRFISGAATESIQPKDIDQVNFISVQRGYAPMQSSGLLEIDQFRLWVVDSGIGSMICVPDRLFSRLHAARFYLERFVNKTKWRIKVTLEIWGIIPWQGQS